MIWVSQLVYHLSIVTVPAFKASSTYSGLADDRNSLTVIFCEFLSSAFKNGESSNGANI